MNGRLLMNGSFKLFRSDLRDNREGVKTVFKNECGNVLCPAQKRESLLVYYARGDGKSIMAKFNFVQVDYSIPMAAGGISWLCEFVRLFTRCPIVETHVLRDHSDQVNHVAFSNNGRMFSTCSKDGFVRV